MTSALKSFSLLPNALRCTHPTFPLSSQKRLIQTITSSKLSKPLPQRTWDSHMHVVDPHKFPLDAKAQYTPHPHTIDDARAFYSQFDIQNMVFVQPSIYGNDNSCMLEALRQVGSKHGRAVVQFDPNNIDYDTLQSWHKIGVRGVRVNLLSTGRVLTDDELRAELMLYAQHLRPFNWVIELFIPLKMAATLEKIVPYLGVKICIGHFGSIQLPEPYDPSTAIDLYSFSGFESLINLMKGDTWVKMAGQYRISKDPQMRDLDHVGRELIKEASNRVVYATDWPHTRFDNIDSVPFIEKCYEWCGNETGLIEKLFRTNAEELWDVR